VTLSADDRLDILDVLARADNAATARDADIYVGLFTDDAVLDGDKGEHRGRRALVEGVSRVWASEGSRSVHLTLNPVIAEVPGDPDRVVATSMLLIMDPGPPPRPADVSAITQHLERTADGWRIARRTVARP
jgi:ketosteroid isomerase-like protein